MAATSVTVETLPAAPAGMVTAVTAEELEDIQCAYLQDGLLDFPGQIRRRGPVRRAGGFPTFSFPGTGLAMTLTPAGQDRYAVLNGDAGAGFFSALSADRLTKVDLAWPHPLPTAPDFGAPFRIVDSKAALNGGTWVGVSSAYNSAAPNQGLALWKGCSKANYTAGTLSVARGSASVTGAGTAWLNNVEPGMFLFANVDAPESYSMTLVGVVKVVVSDTSITLDRVSPYNITGKAYTLQSLRGFAPQVAKGRITCDIASTTVSGGGTKFLAQGITGSGTWNLYRASDFVWIGKVASVVSETSLSLAANAAVAVADGAFVALRADSDWGIETISSANKVGFLNALYAGRGWWANNGAQLEKTYRLWYGDPDHPESVDLSADGDWIAVNSSGPVNEGIRAITPAYNALVVNKETETFAIYGSSPSTFNLKKLEDDGCLSGMSVQSYGGGVIWAGRLGIHFYDGIDTKNLTAPILGDVWKNSIVNLDAGTYRMWSMMVRQHYFLFIERLTPSIPVVKGNTSTTPSSWTICINMVTQALSIHSNVRMRGAVRLPGSITSDSVWWLSNDGEKANICSGDSLFDEEGLDDFFADAQYQALVQSHNPNGYWRLGTQLTTEDFSANSNTLTAVGTPVDAAGLLTQDPSRARDFNGTNQAYTAADHASLRLGDVFTLEAWIKPDSVTGNHMILSRATDAYELRTEDAAIALRKTGTGQIVKTTGLTLVAGNTYHVVATKSGGTAARIYVNGVDYSGTVTDQTCVTTATTTGLYIGSSPTATEYFDGVIDEPAVYPTAISAAQVLQHYQLGAAAAVFFPDFYFVSKKFGGRGVGLQLKRFLYVLIHYAVGGADLKVDTVLGLNDDGKLTTTLPATVYTWDVLKTLFPTWDNVKSEFATWSSVVASVFLPKRRQITRKSQYLQFRIYQGSGTVQRVRLGAFAIGYKYMRPGRPS